MRRAVRFRRLAKWLGLIFSVVVLSAIALSSRYQVDYFAGHLGVFLSPAALSIDAVEAPYAGESEIRRTDPSFSIWRWRWPGVWLDYVPGLGVFLGISLWLLLAA